MKFTTILALSLPLGAYAAPTKRETSVYDIILSNTADVSAVLASIGLNVDSEIVTNVYNNTQFTGFSGSFTAEQVDALSAFAEVSIVDPVVNTVIQATRSSTPWGLQRISQTGTLSNTASASSTAYTYTYSSTALGSGVDIYIIDTGIRTTHTQFGSRASMGYTAFTSNTDDNGHGTHVSGTSAGSTVGIASNANLIGVKVLDSSGSGTSSGLLSGINYVLTQHNSRKSASNFVASVASLSLGFDGRSTAVETALKSLSTAGVHVAVAAGNSAANACNYTPGALGGTASNVVSVGASTIQDQVASFSNTGTCVDVYAPGYTTYSSWYSSSTAYYIASGTSMATPHISGLMAYLLAIDNTYTPATLKSKIKSLAVSGYLTAGSANVITGSVLIIAQNDAASTTSTTEVSTESVDVGEAELVPGETFFY